MAINTSIHLSMKTLIIVLLSFIFLKVESQPNIPAKKIFCDSVQVCYNGSCIWISKRTWDLLLKKSDTTNNWLPKNGTAVNSNLLQGVIDSAWIKNNNKTYYAGTDMYFNGDTIEFNHNIEGYDSPSLIGRSNRYGNTTWAGLNIYNNPENDLKPYYQLEASGINVNNYSSLYGDSTGIYYDHVDTSLFTDNHIPTIKWTKNYINSHSGYTLPIASGSTLGGIKVGSGLSIDGSGVLSSSSQGLACGSNNTGYIEYTGANRTNNKWYYNYNNGNNPTYSTSTALAYNGQLQSYDLFIPNYAEIKELHIDQKITFPDNTEQTTKGVSITDTANNDRNGTLSKFLYNKIQNSGSAIHDSILAYQSLFTKDVISLVSSNMSSDIVASTTVSKILYRIVQPFSVTSVIAGLKVAASGGLFTVDIKKNGTSIFSTVLTFDSGEATTTTAATPCVLTSNPTLLSVDDYVEVFVTQAGSSNAGQGLIVSLIGNKK